MFAKVDSKKQVDDISCISLSGCVPPCEVKDMSPSFLEKLLFAQKMYGKKFKVNSAFRSRAWEKSKGRSGSSSHCLGVAVDISTPTHLERMYMIAAFLLAGFRRIGIARTFIHVDDDSKKSPSMWLYHPEDLTKTF